MATNPLISLGYRPPNIGGQVMDFAALMQANRRADENAQLQKEELAMRRKRLDMDMSKQDQETLKDSIYQTTLQAASAYRRGGVESAAEVVMNAGAIPEGMRQRMLQELQGNPEEAFKVAGATLEGWGKKIPIVGYEEKLGSDLGFPGDAANDLFRRSVDATGRPGKWEVLSKTQDVDSPEVAAQKDRRAALSATRVKVDTGDRGPQIGTIPQGMQVFQDPATGAYRMEPIPGSEAEREREELAEKGAGREKSKVESGKIVLEDIGRAKDLVMSNPTLTTGIVGQFLKYFGGTDASDVSSLIDTIGANIGFDALNAMRQNSPTGGALGAVSERELRLLTATLGSLEQSQTPEQFLRNLERLEEQFSEVVHGPDSPLTKPVEGRTVITGENGEKVEYVKRGGSWFRAQ